VENPSGVFACVLGATPLEDGTIEVDFELNYEPGDLNTPGDLHYHVFLNPPGVPGSNFGSGAWHADAAASPTVVASPVSVADAQANGSTDICMVVANGGEHTAVEGTGNCIPFEV
jgi:hypothetical protein